MELFLQMGHGMQGVAKELIKTEGKGTVIISPMNISQSTIKEFSKKIQKIGGKVLFDPQLYYPQKYQKKLREYQYWPQNKTSLLKKEDFEQIIPEIVKINECLHTEQIILPSVMNQKVDDAWNKIQMDVIDISNRCGPDFSKIHTIAISPNILDHEEQIERIIAYVEDWDVEGLYVVAGHPQSYYLIEKPLWIANLLSLVAGIKRLKKKVIVGYASHQMLCLALAKCDAIASGNFLNLRWFQPEHFETKLDKSKSRRAIWYYCPQVLSEYKIPFLDIAKRMNLLEYLEPAEEMKSIYSEMLFKAVLPSSSGFGEGEAFRHYLHCLSVQCRMSVRDTYQKTRDSQILVLKTAEQLLNGFDKKGIKGQNRDFSEIIDVNRAAISAFDMSYQFPMQNEWNDL